MRENLTIQVGKCGIQTGHEFWKHISPQHSINPNGLILERKNTVFKENINSFFRETTQGVYIPRAILFDLEPREIQTIKKGNYSNFYEETSLISTTEGSGNNWSSGYIHALQINRRIEEILRKNSEKCDSLDSFSLFHSITGGTGSGSTCVILEILKEHFPGKIINCYSSIPNQSDQSDIVVHPYNSVLSLRWLHYYADCVTLFENEAIQKLMQNQIKTLRLNYNHVNSIIAKITSAFTLPLRFPTHTETNFEGMLSTLIPLPNLHFLFGSITNDRISGEKSFEVNTFSENFRQLLKNKTVNLFWESGKLMSSMYFKKKCNDYIDLKIMKRVCQDSGINYLNWAPVPIFSNDKDLNIVFNKNLNNDVCFFNHTGIKNIFVKIKNQFDILKKRNAFVNNFLREFSQKDGQEIFSDSKESIEELISAYKYC